MFLVFMAFCVFYDFEISQSDYNTVTMFMEFLARNRISVLSIRNYIAAITAFFKWFNLNYKIFSHHKVTLMFKALQRSVVKFRKFKAVFQIEDLYAIVTKCHAYQFAQMYKTLYLFAYFGFLRISNLVPASKNKFTMHKHLCRGDVMLTDEEVVIVIKWSKTLQATNQGSYIVLPKIRCKMLCPWYNFKLMSSMYPVPPNLPCFSSATSLMLTEFMVRNHLKTILTAVDLDTTVYGFHTFRRSGATLAFNLDISMEEIKRHGTWRSDAVNSYIVADPLKAAGVSNKFKRFFNK